MPFPSATPNASRRQNIILIILDTHRADRLGFNGSTRGASPNLDEFTRSATVFERAIAPAQWTIPSHASMFTGLPPSTHLTTQANSVLDDQFATFAELLSRAGYETTGFCNNPLLGLIHNNLKRGYQTFYNYSGTTPDIPQDFPDSSLYPLIRLWESFLQTVRKMVDPIQNQFAMNPAFLQAAVNPFFVPLWSRFVHFKGHTARSIRHTSHFVKEKAGRTGNKPFLLFLNLMETHLPYIPPREYALRFAPYIAQDRRATAFMAHFNTLAMHWLIPLKQPFTAFEARIVSDMYDAEVAYQDHLLGELLEELQKPAIRDHSLVIVAADHGEMLGEHQFMGHGFGVYRELIQVPLVIRAPGQMAGVRVPSPVLTTRLFHTILSAAGMHTVASPTGAETETQPFSLIDRTSGLPGDPGQGGMAVVSEAYAPQDAVRMMERREPELIDPLQTRLTHRAYYTDNLKLYDIESTPPRLLTHADTSPEPVQFDADQQAALQEDLTARLEGFVQASREGRPEGWTSASTDLSNPVIEQRLRDLGYIQ